MKRKTIFISIGAIIALLCSVFGVVKLLESNNSKNNSKTEYVIITDTKYVTMENDGGSHRSVYYEINDNIVKKLEDKYIGFEGYEYQRKIIYEKKISSDQKQELIDLLDKLLSKKDINNTNNSFPFVVKKQDENKTIYNESSIKLLKEAIENLDNL